MRKPDLTRCVPCGVDPRVQTRTFLVLGAAALVFALYSFFVRFAGALADLPVNSVPAYDLGRWAGLPEWYMRDFYSLIDGVFSLFAVLIISMLFFAVVYYAGHYSGSKSIYLMRRLPRRGELWVRCLALPVASALAALAAAALLLAIFYAVYMLATPAECILPGQWQMFIVNFWSVIA